MNRYTQFGEILQEHVQPHRPYWISRS